MRADKLFGWPATLQTLKDFSQYDCDYTEHKAHGAMMKLWPRRDGLSQPDPCLSAINTQRSTEGRGTPESRISITSASLMAGKDCPVFCLDCGHAMCICPCLCPLHRNFHQETSPGGPVSRQRGTHGCPAPQEKEGLEMSACGQVRRPRGLMPLAAE